MKSMKAHQNAPRRAIRLSEVCHLLGMSPATIWRRNRDDADFPKSFKLSAGVTVWDEKDVQRWLEAKKNVADESRRNAVKT